MFGFLKPEKFAAPLPQQKVTPAYKKYRMQVFAAAYLSYLMYYVVRSTMAFAKPYFMEELGFSMGKTALITSIGGAAYGVGRLFMGVVADRSNARYLLPLGLIISGVMNFLMPTTQNLIFLCIIWGINGWFQSAGWGSCARLLTHWFSDNERGRKMTAWNTAHNIGAGFLPFVVLFGFFIFGKSLAVAFWFPASLAIIFGIVSLVLAKDTPQSVGLPPIEEYRDDFPAIIKEVEDKEKELSVKEIFLKFVLKNKALWILAFANVFVYIVRYGVADWSSVYLKNVKHMSQRQYGFAFLLFEVAAIPGSIAIGWVSDKLFKGKRGPVSIICLLGVIFAVLTYWKSTNFFWIYAAIALVGAFIYGPVSLIGINAVDLVPKKAAGTAAGFTGLFGYLGGQVLANVAMAWVVQKYGWSGGFIAIIGCSVLSIVLLFFTWNSHKIEKTPQN